MVKITQLTALNTSDTDVFLLCSYESSILRHSMKDSASVSQQNRRGIKLSHFALIQNQDSENKITRSQTFSF